MATSQCMEALARANKIRLARAELKRSIGRGEVDVAALLEPEAEIPWEAESMRVDHLLAARHRWGPVRASKLLRRLGIGQVRPVGNLTPRERIKLTAALRGESDPYLWQCGEVLR